MPLRKRMSAPGFSSAVVQHAVTIRWPRLFKRKTIGCYRAPLEALPNLPLRSALLTFIHRN